jgi:hypothetical protein
MEVEELVNKKRKHADADLNTKWCAIALYFKNRNANGRLPDGVREQIMEKCGISSSSLRNYVEEFEQKIQEPGVPDLSNKREGNCGVHNLMLTHELINMIYEFSAEKKGNFTYQSFARQFNARYGIAIPWRTLYDWFKRLGVSQQYSFVKPALKDKHKEWRLRFILEKLQPHDGDFHIRDQRYHVHVDEKWFYAVREYHKIKVLPDQQFPDETTRHKSHIIKVMFVAVLGMPQMVNGEKWDGKIGLFPVTRITQAKRNSEYRLAGTDVVENVNLTADVYYDLMTREDGILAAIRDKMYWARNANIVIQHDGAPAHWHGTNNLRLPEAGALHGWNITFQTQPAQSPDLNVCDLCFFNSLQKRSFDLRSKSNTPQQLMDTVRQAWQEYDADTLERCWGHLFAVYREILADKGDNQYIRPHSSVGLRQKHEAGTLDPIVTMDMYLNAVEARDALLNGAAQV